MYKTVSDFVSQESLEGKKVLVRVDFNVPMDENKRILDTTRIDETIPTIHLLCEHGAIVILLSHLGRPSCRDPRFSLEPVAIYLQKLTSYCVFFSMDCRGLETKSLCERMYPSNILVLENLRFYKEEEENNLDFAKELASYGDFYVNDAFGTIHRSHASNVGILQFMSSSYLGLLMEKELYFFFHMMDEPKRPFMAILGGSKISTKLQMIHSLLEKVNVLFIGGCMAFPFFKHFGYCLGCSFFENVPMSLIESILVKAQEKNVTLLFPVDLVVRNGNKVKIVPKHAISNGWEALDHGPITKRILQEHIYHSKTVFWNGPMGKYESSLFHEGTVHLLQTITDQTKIRNITSIVGGGDSVGIVKNLSQEKNFTHVSTGGGSLLRLFEEKLPLSLYLLQNTK